MMFVSALNDRVAPPHDPLKMVARLQDEAAQGGPYFLLPLRASGHGGGTTLTALVDQDVDELSFYCWHSTSHRPRPARRARRAARLRPAKEGVNARQHRQRGIPDCRNFSKLVLASACLELVPGLLLFLGRVRSVKTWSRGQ